LLSSCLRASAATATSNLGILLIYIAEEWTCITGNPCHVTATYCCVTSPRTRKTQLCLLLRVGPCLRSCCLASR
jgi:hypothetical protein